MRLERTRAADMLGNLVAQTADSRRAERTLCAQLTHPKSKSADRAESAIWPLALWASAT
jgi:hypothetical protein